MTTEETMGKTQQEQNRLRFEQDMFEFTKRFAPENPQDNFEFQTRLASMMRQLFMDVQQPMHEMVVSAVMARSPDPVFIQTNNK